MSFFQKKLLFCYKLRINLRFVYLIPIRLPVSRFKMEIDDNINKKGVRLAFAGKSEKERKRKREKRVTLNVA